MKNKRFISILMMIMLLGFSVFLAACAEEDDGSEYIPDELDGLMTMTVELASDSDNGSEWIFEQDGELFECEDAFMDNGEGSSEKQSFLLIPQAAGKTTVSFTNEAESTTYTYECEINEDFSKITINNATGETAGEAVEPPEPVLERN